MRPFSCARPENKIFALSDFVDRNEKSNLKAAKAEGALFSRLGKDVVLAGFHSCVGL
jgi:hypothetical protein